MKKLEMLKTKSVLLIFFMLLFTPVMAYADESTDVDTPDDTNKDAATTTSTEESLKTTESEEITDTTATFEGTYETEEEANNKKDEKEQEYKDAGYENIQSTITEETVTEETGNVIEEYVGSTTETEEEAYVFDNEEDANAKKEELEVDDHDKKVTVTIKKRTVDSGEDEVTTITGTFNSVEEAEAYVADLKAQGYTVEYTITQDSHEETDTLEEIYDKKADAEDALAGFEATHSNVEGTIEPVKTDSDTVVETTTLDTPYATEAEAQTALDEYISNNETDTYYFTGEVTGPTGTGEYNTQTINKTFATEAEALAYVAELEGQGYTVIYTFTHDTKEESGSIENEKYATREAAEEALAAFKEQYPNAEGTIEVIEAGTVYTANTITEDMKIYQIGSTTFILIKHGNEFFVWTENELTSDEQTQFKNTYKEVATDNVITGSVIESKGQFVYGYNITYHTKNGKSFSFVLDEDNTIKIIMDSGGESRVVYGEFAPVVQYVLNATGSKTVELETGTLTGEQKKEIEAYFNKVTKKAKKYKLTASGKKTVMDDTYTLTGTKSKDIMKDEYVLDVTTETKQYKYYPETIDKTLYKLVVKADIPEQKEKKQKKTKKVKKSTVIANPQTGDSIISYIVTLTISMGSLAGVSSYRRKED